VEPNFPEIMSLNYFAMVLLMFLSYLFPVINCEVLFLHVLLIYYLYVY